MHRIIVPPLLVTYLRGSWDVRWGSRRQWRSCDILDTGHLPAWILRWAVREPAPVKVLWHSGYWSPTCVDPEMGGEGPSASEGLVTFWILATYLRGSWDVQWGSQRQWRSCDILDTGHLPAWILRCAVREPAPVKVLWHSGYWPPTCVDPEMCGEGAGASEGLVTFWILATYLRGSWDVQWGSQRQWRSCDILDTGHLPALILRCAVREPVPVKVLWHSGYWPPTCVDPEMCGEGAGASEGLVTFWILATYLRGSWDVQWGSRCQWRSCDILDTGHLPAWILRCAVREPAPVKVLWHSGYWPPTCVDPEMCSEGAGASEGLVTFWILVTYLRGSWDGRWGSRRQWRSCDILDTGHLLAWILRCAVREPAPVKVLWHSGYWSPTCVDPEMCSEGAGASEGLVTFWILVTSGGTIHKKRESIIEPLMELRIDHHDIAVL